MLYPNLFLTTFWSMDLRPQVFVAMSFADKYKPRFDDVIAPAIESINWNGVRLKPFRVDQSKTGDSILTEIIDGIAHSELFLADVSVMGYDSRRPDEPYRNGNVMYEVGLALAARQPSEILLIRDDLEKFLFDVSTIPHKHMDFTDSAKASAELKDELMNRLKERDFIFDARVQRAVSSVTVEEKNLLEVFAGQKPGGIFTLTKFHLRDMAGLSRLLDKQLIQVVAKGIDGLPGYRWTRLGYTVASRLDSILPKVAWAPKPTKAGADETSGLEPERNA